VRPVRKPAAFPPAGTLASNRAGVAPAAATAGASLEPLVTLPRMTAPAPPTGVRPPPLLGPPQRDLILGRASIIVATSNAALAPHLMRAVGCRFSPDDRLVILVTRSGSAPLLADVVANARMAVVFSRPSTLQTLQLKGTDARCEPATAADVDLARDYARRMVEEVGLLGFDAVMAHGAFDARADDLVALSFTPSAVFEQTPGPRAGEPLVISGDGS
jgi:hypothetical protein